MWSSREGSPGQAPPRSSGRRVRLRQELWRLEPAPILSRLRSRPPPPSQALPSSSSSSLPLSFPFLSPFSFSSSSKMSAPAAKVSKKELNSNHDGADEISGTERGKVRGREKGRKAAGRGCAARRARAHAAVYVCVTASLARSLSLFLSLLSTPPPPGSSLQLLLLLFPLPPPPPPAPSSPAASRPPEAGEREARHQRVAEGGGSGRICRPRLRGEGGGGGHVSVPFVSRVSVSAFLLFSRLHTTDPGGRASVVFWLFLIFFAPFLPAPENRFLSLPPFHAACGVFFFFHCAIFPLYFSPLSPP